MKRSQWPWAVAGLLPLALLLLWLFLRQAPTENSLPVLHVLSYESFTGLNGAGPAIVADFERNCGCRVELLSASDSGLLLEKLSMAKGNLTVDVVIGLDQFLLVEANKVTAWRVVEVAEDFPWLDSMHSYLGKEFIPVDWAPLTFIYRKSEIEPPSKWSDLSDPRFRSTMSLQDPRTSSPGMQLVVALSAIGDPAEFAARVAKLKPSVQTVSPSWSTAYGMFQRGQTKLTFSFVTSLAYHWEVEKNRDYQAANLDEGHPVQVEFAGVPDFCKQCSLAKDFVRYLLSAEAQKMFMRKNFMFPVRDGLIKGSVFAELPQLKLLPTQSAVNLAARRAELLKIWLEAIQ